jgi:hypothetical protein
VDNERDHLFADLRKTGDLADEYTVDGFHTQREGRNGGGDPWHTDGRLFVGAIDIRTVSNARPDANKGGLPSKKEEPVGSTP